ncbi:MAG: hypothetical protein J6S14_12670 [Clostridia bacterium]|nr:hypothetical protein [Clostridia bacterium]
MANWNFDPSQYSEKNFEIIPVGDYRARISDVVEKKFSTGNEGYEITLDINGYNSKMWFYLVLDASNPAQTNQRIGDFFNSFGIVNPAMGSGKQWIGAVGAVRVKHEPYNGENRAKVAYCIARNRQDKLPAWQNTAGVATPQTAPTFETVEIPDDLPF